MKILNLTARMLLLSGLCFLLNGVVPAQNLPPLTRIKGTVVDAVTGEPLPGATIRLGTSTKGTSTDAKGNFQLENLSGNEIALGVTFVGYKQHDLKVDLRQKKQQPLTIRLIPLASELQQIEVKGQAEGQVKAMLEQRVAVNIKNVVSAEQIEKFPDVNAADAIQRIPGITLQRDQGEGRFIQLRGTPPELTNFNINGEQIPSPEGNVRYVGMDVIPANQIDVIEVSKVFTPDMDADGIGGTVNIITKKASGDKPEINALVSGGFNNLREKGNMQAQFSYGNRYNKFGFYINGSHYLNNQGADNLEFKFAKGPFWGSTGAGVDNYYVQYRQFQLRHYDITRQRTGLSTTLDYQFNDHSSVYIRGMFNRFSDNETRRRKIYDLEDAVSETYYLYGGVDHDIKKREKIQQISTVNAGGEHPLLGGTLDYELAYASATEDQPDRFEAQFDNPGHAIAMEIIRTDPDWPTISFPDPDNAQNAFDYDNYSLDELLMQKEYVSDQNITAKLNYKIPYLTTPGNEGYIKFGAKMRMKDKERDITAQNYGAYKRTSGTYPGTGPKLSVNTISDGFSDANLLDHGYLVDHMPGVDQLTDFFTYNQQFFIIDRTGTKVKNYGEDYSAKENIFAGYIMVRHDIGKLMLLGGVRFEHTDIDYQGMRILTKKGVFDTMQPLTDKRTHRFILPQFQTRYSFTPKFNLRGAVTFTYSRPNFEDVLPYREEDYDEVRYGNPDLAFPKSVNFDLLAEQYIGGDGVISGGLFYKNVTDFVFYYKRFAHEGDPANYGLVEITKAQNGDRANVMGAEVMVQSKLNFLTGFWKDFGVYFNYTFTHSDAWVNKRLPANYTDAVVIFGSDSLELFTSTTEQEKITLPGQAKHALNAAVFFDNKTFYAKLSLNYHNEFLHKLGADADLDEYYDRELHLDFNANYNINPYLNVFVDVVNITNSPLKYYLGTRDRVLKQEFYSWWGRLGLKINL
ncbi:MAG: TonB-dependent receptor [Bacteroidales bacterium]|nr:TonB-dependent receptor [Bacteroidales bacterium]